MSAFGLFCHYLTVHFYIIVHIMLKPSAVGHFTQMEKGISLPHTVIIPLIQHFLKVTASKVFSLLDVSKFQIPVV